jgi:hypothetical protein
VTAQTSRRERRQVSELMLRAERAFDEARTAARALDGALGPGTGDELMAAVAQAIRGAHAAFARERGGQPGAGGAMPNAHCPSAGDGQQVGNRAGGAHGARAPRAGSTGSVDPWSATPSGGAAWIR